MMATQTQDYEVLGMLGKGGFAQVFRAKSKSNGQEVAIKQVSKLSPTA
jgi:serine/threonine protein kinase